MEWEKAAITGKAFSTEAWIRSYQRRNVSVERKVTVWATGDAVLERIGSINWETKEYILEGADEFLTEISPARRRITIGDAEQLAETSIVLAWSSASTLLLLGTDNRNVMAWTREGYAENGSALALNQETSKWISNHRSQVEGVYVRSGRNFSPDRMTRAEYDQIEAWAVIFEFTRVRRRPMWDEMMMDYRSLRLIEGMIPEIRSERKNQEKLRCAGWNGGGASLVEAAHGFGSIVQFVGSRHDQVINQFCQRYGFEPPR